MLKHRYSSGDPYSSRPSRTSTTLQGPLKLFQVFFLFGDAKASRTPPAASVTNYNPHKHYATFIKNPYSVFNYGYDLHKYLWRSFNDSHKPQVDFFFLWQTSQIIELILQTSNYFRTSITSSYFKNTHRHCLNCLWSFLERQCPVYGDLLVKRIFSSCSLLQSRTSAADGAKPLQKQTNVTSLHQIWGLFAWTNIHPKRHEMHLKLHRLMEYDQIHKNRNVI